MHSNWKANNTMAKQKRQNKKTKYTEAVNGRLTIQWQNKKG